MSLFLRECYNQRTLRGRDRFWVVPLYVVRSLVISLREYA